MNILLQLNNGEITFGCLIIMKASIIFSQLFAKYTRKKNMFEVKHALNTHYLIYNIESIKSERQIINNHSQIVNSYN